MLNTLVINLYSLLGNSQILKWIRVPGTKTSKEKEEHDED